MSPISRGAWYALTVGRLTLSGAVVLVIANEDLGLVGFIVSALIVLAIGVLLFFDARDKRLEEEAEEPALARAREARPIESLASDFEEATQSMRKWSFPLGWLALFAAALRLARTGSDFSRDALMAVAPAVPWIALAVVAWHVGKSGSRAWSVVLPVVPALDLMARLAEKGLAGDADLWVPLCFLAVGGRCCWLTFRYRRHLRLAG